jgi:hypothetical protein
MLNPQIQTARIKGKQAGRIKMRRLDTRNMNRR